MTQGLTKVIRSTPGAEGTLAGLCKPSSLKIAGFNIADGRFYGLHHLATLEFVDAARLTDVISRAGLEIEEIDLVPSSGLAEIEQSARLKAISAAVKEATGQEPAFLFEDTLASDAQSRMLGETGLEIALNLPFLLAGGHNIEYILAHEYAHFLAEKKGYSRRVASMKIINPSDRMLVAANPSLQGLLFNSTVVVNDFCQHFVVNHLLAAEFGYQLEVEEDYRTLWHRVEEGRDACLLRDFADWAAAREAKVSPLAYDFETARLIAQAVELLVFLPEETLRDQAWQMFVSSMGDRFKSVVVDALQLVPGFPSSERFYALHDFLADYSPRRYCDLYEAITVSLSLTRHVSLNFLDALPELQAGNQLKSVKELLAAKDIWPALKELASILISCPEQAEALGLQKDVREQLLATLTGQGYSQSSAAERLKNLAERFDVPSEVSYWDGLIG
ncbi:MAG: hypothetical protein ABH823_01050 [bacterium]